MEINNNEVKLLLTKYDLVFKTDESQFNWLLIGLKKKESPENKTDLIIQYFPNDSYKIFTKDNIMIPLVKLIEKKELLKKIINSDYLTLIEFLKSQGNNIVAERLVKSHENLTKMLNIVFDSLFTSINQKLN